MYDSRGFQQSLPLAVGIERRGGPHPLGAELATWDFILLPNTCRPRRFELPTTLAPVTLRGLPGLG